MLTGGIRALSQYIGLEVIGDVLDDYNETRLRGETALSGGDPPAVTPTTSGTGAANAGMKAAKATKRAKDFDSMFAVGGDERK